MEYTGSVLDMWKTQEIIGDHEIVDGNFYFEGKSCVKAKKNILSFIYSTSKSETFGLIQCGNYLCGMKRVERIIYSNKVRTHGNKYAQCDENA